MDFPSILARHDRIAFQLSGGRDSLAALELLRAHWHQMTVYWCNPGAPFPETLEIMEWVKLEVPNFVEIAGAQPQTIAQYGLPSDLVPVSRTAHGMAISGEQGVMLQDRYACCARSMMEPTHARMVADGITLIIRGQKDADGLKSPLRSGAVVDGVELLFPIQDWTNTQVMRYLQGKAVPIPRFYQHMNSAPDCMTCSAYWEEGAASYLKQYHPEAHAEVQSRLDLINAAVGVHIAAFNKEVN